MKNVMKMPTKISEETSKTSVKVKKKGYLELLPVSDRVQLGNGGGDTERPLQAQGFDSNRSIQKDRGANNLGFRDQEKDFKLDDK